MRRKRIIRWLLCVLTGVILFLFFLYVHYQSDSVELLLIESRLIGWDIAPLIVRGIVGIGWLLALLMLVPFSARKRASEAAFVFFAVFTTFFIAQWLLYGNLGKCRCFHLYLNNNILTIILIGAGVTTLTMLTRIGLNQTRESISMSLQRALLIAGFLGTQLLSFGFNPLRMGVDDPLPPGTHLPLDLLYPEKGRKPSVDLRKGKHIVAFMSFTCPYCKTAARKFRVLKKLNPRLPLFMVVTGKKENERSFFEKTGAANVPHFKYVSKDIFWQLARHSIPSIYLIEHSSVYKRIHHSELNKKHIEAWLNQ